MSNAMLSVVMLTLTFNMNAQNLSDTTIQKPLISATNSTIVEGWRTGDTLSSLIRVGLTNHLPLGIVLEGDSLCKSTVPGSSEGISIASLMEQVQKQDPTYSAEIRNHVLYVHPKAMKASTLNALELRIPNFISEAASVQIIGANLWMHIRGVLVPQETSMFAVPSRTDTETLPAIHLSNSSVHDILDRIITSGQGGAWVMYQVPADWHSDPKTTPYEILSYSGDQRSAELIKCP